MDTHTNLEVKKDHNETNIDKIISNDFSTFWIRDLSSGELTVSKGIEAIYKRSAAEFNEDSSLWEKLFHPDDRAILEKIASKLLKGEATDYEYRILLPDGTIRWVRDQAAPMMNNKNEMIKTYGFISDITDYKDLQKELIQNQQHIQQIIESVDMSIWSHNFLTGDTIYSSNSTKIFGLPSVAFQENSNLWWEIIHPEDVEAAFRHLNTLEEGNPTTNTYRIIRPGDGQIRWVNDRAIPIKDDHNNVIGFQGVKVDVTETKMTEEKIHYMAFHDSLTGLPNRYHLNKRLDELLAQYEGTTSKLAILFIDLDRFKLINDTLGHYYGDLLLTETAKRLSHILSTKGMVARQGGDEFILLLEETDCSEVEEISKKIIEKFTSPFDLEGREVFSTPSIGISIFPENGQDSDTLVRNADLSMYEAKRKGKNRYRFFDTTHMNTASHTVSMEIDLRKALNNQEFLLHYQPIIHLENGDMTGVEALIRWESPNRGLVPPLEFIPLAEETGLIVPIGEWVMFHACQQLKQWHSLGYKKVDISVNVSMRQFQEENFVSSVEQVLTNTGLNPHYLTIEITESIMQNTNESISIINELKKLGVKIAIDDFGTGYSSLSILRDLSLDKIKIDKTFVNDIGTNKDFILKTMIDLAKNLNMQIVAEGIESEQHAEFLQNQHCDFGQGFYFAKPTSADTIENLLKKASLI